MRGLLYPARVAAGWQLTCVPPLHFCATGGAVGAQPPRRVIDTVLTVTCACCPEPKP